MRPERPIALVAALREELATVPLLDERTEELPWGLARRGRVGSVPLLLVTAGIGEEAARRATKWVLGEDPALVVAFGFSGGLAPVLCPGDLVLARALSHESSDIAHLQPRSALVSAAHEALGDAGRVACGLAVTANEVVPDEAAKAMLAKSGALAVDLESYWVAHECHAAGIPWLALRAVVDHATRALPRFAVESTGSRARDFLAPALRHALSRPSGVFDLAWLGWASHLASKSLGRAAERLPEAFAGLAEGT